ncbi:hypothetical protein M441DRAFT_407620 [Trichoderma asperellum CBS 433.97]|uniref:Uncharacterized protein n=1 Tax=Trichoderma asperellum (strain ATCC 204424 / CBS 433.97 / NBRC 101777) TaxID=1042311 RepID=A0A2T3Z6U9_TRIA4|nr:hypothetical protein M441DRAFT_407620 [Trichoderma asperellum CBS 433.97]PTB40529.1 hypothetical protein M441DRAFT_407620 [Trichoderma asperellum CBS 433.97]
MPVAFPRRWCTISFSTRECICAGSRAGGGPLKEMSIPLWYLYGFVKLRHIMVTESLIRVSSSSSTPPLIIQRSKISCPKAGHDPRVSASSHSRRINHGHLFLLSAFLVFNLGQFSQQFFVLKINSKVDVLMCGSYASWTITHSPRCLEPDYGYKGLDVK